MAPSLVVQPGGGSVEPPAVLVVEDEPTTRQMMRLFLKTSGYAAIEADTVERASQALSTNLTAAILDVQLAGERSGLEVLAPLRRRPELADIPVLVLTGGILSDAEETLIRQQHAYVFYKPEGYDTIVSFLDRLVGRSDAHARPEHESFSRLRRDFLAQVQRETCWLRTDLASGLDVARARQILHRWTGLAGTLGLAEISRRALDLQVLVDDPVATTAGRLREKVDEIASLCRDFALAPVEARPLSEAVAGRLVGKRVAVIDLGLAAGAWIVRALEEALAFSKVLESIDAAAVALALEPFDLLVISASAESKLTSGGRIADAGLPVLAVGPLDMVAQHLSAFPGSDHDFLITPCEPEEFVLRACRLLSGERTRPGAGLVNVEERKPRVIVADDDATITTLVTAALQNSNFDCDIARDGQQTLDLMKTLTPDAIVLDVNMPQFNGFEVLDRIRNNPLTCSVPVVLLSARQQEADIMRGFELGADDYVVKPFSPLELTARVKRLVGQRPAPPQLEA